MSKYLDEYKDYVGDLTIAEKIKFTTEYEWAWGELPTPEEAIKNAKSNCSPDEIAKRNETGNLAFESELGAIEAIKSIAGLSEEEAQKFEEEVFIQSSISEDLAQKVRTAFETQGTENKVIDSLIHIHDNWVRNHHDNFQKVTVDKQGNEKKRDRDYQFVDLRLMSYGKDGACADLLFIEPILEACGISIDSEKLEEAFKTAQEKFLSEKNIHTSEDLLRHIEQGSKTYPALEGLVAYDRIPIDEHLKNKEISEHMAEQVENRSGISLKKNEINFNSIAAAIDKTEEKYR